MIDFSKVVSVEEMIGEDDAESSQLNNLCKKATTFLLDFKWVNKIDKIYFGIGAADIFGVFLFQITPFSNNVPSFIWVVVGDIPSAYIVTDDSPNPACALDAYLGELDRWVEAVRDGSKTDELMPIGVKPSRENADDLDTRIKFLRSEVLAEYKNDLT